MEHPTQAGVLVVEDDPAYQSIYEKALGSLDLQCHLTKTGAQALALLREKRPQLIICDVSLPDMSGFELCQKVKSGEAKGPPILMITGSYRKDEDRLRAQTIGADAYLLKPFRLPEFLAIVKKFTRYSPDR